jgi:hypothetical protein
VAGTRTFLNTISQWPSIARCAITGMLRTISTPGASIGTRIMLWRWCAGASIASFDTPITMARRQAGCSAPVMNHLRPLIT